MTIATKKVCPNCGQPDVHPVSLTSYDGVPMGIYVCEGCMKAWDYCDLEDKEVNVRINTNDKYDEGNEINKLRQRLTSVI